MVRGHEDVCRAFCIALRHPRAGRVQEWAFCRQFGDQYVPCDSAILSSGDNIELVELIELILEAGVSESDIELIEFTEIEFTDLGKPYQLTDIGI